MIEVLSTNILSPLGETTEANLAAVLRGDSAVRLWSGHWGLPYAFQAALFSDEQHRTSTGAGHASYSVPRRVMSRR